MLAGDVIRRLARVGRSEFFEILGAAVCAAVRRGRRNDCLVMKIDALGDLFIWFSTGLADVAAEARRDGRRPVVLVRPELVEFVQALGCFDEVWALDPRAFRHDIGYRLQTLVRLRRHGFARILQMRLAREYLQEDAITRVVGAAEAVSPVGDLSNMTAVQAKKGDRLYRPLLKVEKGHELERNRAVARALTGREPSRFELPDNTSALGGVPTPYYIVAPGAGWDGRRWGAKNFAAVVQTISGAHCVVAGTRADIEEGDTIAAAAEGLNLCGKLSVMELAHLVRGASFVLANESGISHMAAYFGVSSVAVLGGGHFGWFMPYPDRWPHLRAPVPVFHSMVCFGCNWHCIYPRLPATAVPCIEKVDRYTVIAAIREIYTPQ